MQVKLLRVLQEKGVFAPSAVSKPGDPIFRVIAATNRDLATEVDRGTFRRDLFLSPECRHHPAAPAARRSAKKIFPYSFNIF